VHTHDGSTFDNRVTLTFDLLISASIHADRLPYTVCLLSLVLTVLAVLERGQTDRQTDTQTSQTPLITTLLSSNLLAAGVGVHRLKSINFISLGRIQRQYVSRLDDVRADVQYVGPPKTFSF